MSDEQTQRQPMTTQMGTLEAKFPGDAWGQPISQEQQTELQGYLDRWQTETDHGERKGPFAGVPLSGADVYWLAEQSGRDYRSRVPNLHLEGAILVLPLLEGAILTQAHLEGTNLAGARLERADLREAHLEGARLGTAHLERADLREAHLEGAILTQAHLEGTNLRSAWLDSKTILSEATLDRTTSLGDIHWSGVGAVDLTQIHWNQVPKIGDEWGLPLRLSMEDYEAIVRAYRQLAAQLRAQGLSEVADRFSERAQIRRRRLLFRLMLTDWRHPWRLPGDLFRWLFSGFLAVLAGYGYHPGRTLLWYLAIISSFAFAFYQATHGMLTFGIHPSEVPPLQWYEALVLSISAFHGRGFFQPVQTLGDPVAILAAAEAVFGLVIEISFIATVTQRFFGTR